MDENLIVFIYFWIIYMNISMFNKVFFILIYGIEKIKDFFFF